MSIAIEQVDAIGARIITPEGPFGALNGFPSQNFKPGFVIGGDYEAEFVYVLFSVTTAPFTLNQGDFLAWDNSYQAYLLSTATSTRGSSVGTFFAGGIAGGPNPLPFSFTFLAVGVYGLWVQRAGISLANVASTAAAGNYSNTTTTAKTIDAPVTPLTGSKLITGLYLPPASFTFTGTTVIGSNVINGISSAQGMEVGLGLTGTGIPAGAYIMAMNGSSITMGNNVSGASNAATASGTPTVTAARYAFSANTVSGSPTLSNISNTASIYPGQTIAGTGIPASTTILSLNGNPGGYTITLSANATATGTSVAMTTSLLLEAELRWPYIDKTN